MSAEPGLRVRVRRRYAALYPELTADVWLSAREVAQIMVARASQARGQSLHRRTWDPRHFEIRSTTSKVRGAGADALPSDAVAH